MRPVFIIWIRIPFTCSLIVLRVEKCIKTGCLYSARKMFVKIRMNNDFEAFKGLLIAEVWCLMCDFQLLGYYCGVYPVKDSLLVCSLPIMIFFRNITYDFKIHLAVFFCSNHLYNTQHVVLTSEQLL